MQVPGLVGTIIDIIVALALIFSFIGGLRSGAIKEFFGLLAFIISLPLTPVFYGYAVSWFSFVNDATWRGLLGFLVTMGIIILLLYLIFWAPRLWLEKIWNSGFFFSFLGGILGVVNSALGMVLVVNLLDLFPVSSWLDAALTSSGVLNWLVNVLGTFVLSLLRSLHSVGMVASISFFAAL